MSTLQLRLHEERKARLRRMALQAGQQKSKEAYRAKLAEPPPAIEPQPEQPSNVIPAHWVKPEFELSKVVPGRLSIEDVQRYVAQRYGLKRWDLVSESRSAVHVGPRQVAIYLCRSVFGASTPRIGRRFKRDHSTVIHAIRRVKDRLYIDSDYRLAVDQMEAELKATFLAPQNSV